MNCVEFVQIEFRYLLDFRMDLKLRSGLFRRNLINFRNHVSAYGLLKYNYRIQEPPYKIVL
jgi:hypothetical protein